MVGGTLLATPVWGASKHSAPFGQIVVRLSLPRIAALSIQYADSRMTMMKMKNIVLFIVVGYKDLYKVQELPQMSLSPILRVQS